MDLWNEYEGRSIDGLFPLERLIRPEGRSAFFSTTTSGTSTVIRLIESHFDEDEILARWSGVSDLHQPNLLTLTRFGQAMMDETSLVYVVLEPTEADLSQILCERPLTLAETRQVATSLIPALQALHAKGFVHEHVQAVNVLAVGEVVKLRSDCIREAPEGPEGDALRVRDVQDLAMLLLQCLTQQRNPAVSPTGPPLPAPFREIVSNAISGTWGLAQMSVALEASAPPTPRIAAPATPSPAAPAIRELHRKPAPLAATPLPLAPTQTATNRNGLPQGPVVIAAPHRFPEPAAGRIRVPVYQQAGSSSRRLALLAIAVIGLVLFAVYSALHRHSGSKAATTEASQTQSATSAASVPPIGAIPTSPPANQQQVAPFSGSWRVVAYTYNRQDQAEAKSRTLNQQFGSLHPAVFSPTGRAPFLVTLGGAISRDAAFALRDRLRRSGLPRDIYAQNYASKSR